VAEIGEGLIQGLPQSKLIYIYSNQIEIT